MNYFVLCPGVSHIENITISLLSLAASLLQQKMAASSAGVSRRLAVMRALNLNVDDAILDVGCGAGHLLEDIALAVGTNGNVVGLDPSETQLVAARQRCEPLNNVQFLCSMADKIDLPDASCDGIHNYDSNQDGLCEHLRPEGVRINFYKDDDADDMNDSNGYK